MAMSLVSTYTPEELDYWSELYKQQDTESLESSDEWVVFYYGENLYAVLLNTLDEIANVQQGTAVPHAHSCILGLANIRGEPLLLLDMGQPLQQTTTFNFDINNRTLIFKSEDGKRVGFPVNQIYKVTELEQEGFQPLKQDVLVTSNAVTKITEQLGVPVFILDIEFLTETMLKQL
jgi:chemotaxis signal transduction protein